MKRRLDTVAAELAGIKKTIACADAEIRRFWRYHLELQDHATRLAGDLERLKHRQKGREGQRARTPDAGGQEHVEAGGA
jgi:hypothetical protein